jgi:peptidoglycan L-alanyl-D-glutamate endopeptidase CwlK
MARALELLNSITKAKAENLQEVCECTTLIYCTVRSAEKQARLWRQSRSLLEIMGKCQKFRERELGFLADVLENVGPQYGRHVTNACCGESYHQYGLAFDVVPLIHGKCDWKDNWAQIGVATAKVGLEWGGSWTRFVDYPHCQDALGGNPLRIWTPNQVREKICLTT